MATYRLCTCGNKIWYENARSRKRADDKDTTCRSCAIRRVERQLVDGVPHKRCPKCSELKPLSLFNKCTKAGDGVQGYCQSCMNLLSKDDYHAYRKDSSRTRQKQNNENLREKINALKSNPCTDCGGIFHPICMDFDHLPQFHKEYPIAEMVRRRMAWATIMSEIAKCELVCANCHRFRTFTRREAQKRGDF